MQITIAYAEACIAKVDIQHHRGSQMVSHFALVPAQTPSYLGFGHCVAGPDTGDPKLDQMLSVLKAKTNPKTRPISEVGSADQILCF